MKNANARPHELVLATLIMAIREIYGEAINYDHVQLPIPHFPLSLKFGEKNVDIAFVAGERVYYVQVDSRDLSEIYDKEAASDAGCEE